MKIPWTEIHQIKSDSRPIPVNILATASGEILWRGKNFDAQYAYGESKNYLQRHLLFTQFRADSQLTIGTQVYGTHAMESYRAMPASKRDFDNNARHFSLDATRKVNAGIANWELATQMLKKQMKLGFIHAT